MHSSSKKLSVKNRIRGIPAQMLKYLPLHSFWTVKGYIPTGLHRLNMAYTKGILSLKKFHFESACCFLYNGNSLEFEKGA
jgi:hypothetical protein